MTARKEEIAGKSGRSLIAPTVEEKVWKNIEF